MNGSHEVAELAADKTVPACPADVKEAAKVQLCTHGTSLVPLIKDPTTPVRKAAYSQYPRGYVKPGTEQEGMAELASLRGGSSSSPSASACLSKHCTMGYSMLTNHEGKEYRYTEWVDFNTKHPGKPDWDRVVGKELYDHSVDPMENTNIASGAASDLLADLSELLKAHPTA
eukprot:g5036.t1